MAEPRRGRTISGSGHDPPGQVHHDRRRAPRSAGHGATALAASPLRATGSRQDASAAPDLVTPVVAYRAWRVVGDRLLSPNIRIRWEGRTLHATCLPVQRRIMPGHDGWVDEEHVAPHPDCE